MASGPTYTPLATGSLSSLPTTALASIPQTYTDLRLVVQMANTSSNYLAYVYFGSYNGFHSGTVLYGNGSTASSTRYTNDNIVLADYPTSLGMSNSSTTFGAYQYDILGYTNTSNYKTVISRASSPAGYFNVGVHTLRTTSAISSLFISSGGGAFASGSTFTLYGIAAA
jgi:hypothetical protein